MGAAVNGMNIVCVGKNGFVIAVVIHEGNFGASVRADGGKMNRLFVNGSKTAAFVDIFNKRADTALVAEVIFNNIFRVTAVGQRNCKTCVKESGLTQMALKRFIVIDRCFLKNLRVRLELDESSRFVRIADYVEVACNVTSCKALAVDMTVLGNLNLKPFGKGVNNGRAHAVQTAGNLVAAATELSAGVQYGQNNGNGRKSLLLVDTDGYTAAVIADGDNVAGKNFNLNMGAEAGERLVD